MWLSSNNSTSIHEDSGSIPGLTQWVKGSRNAVSCGVAHRCGSDPALLWLWHRPAATAPIRPLAWELPYGGVQPLKIFLKKEHPILVMLLPPWPLPLPLPLPLTPMPPSTPPWGYFARPSIHSPSLSLFNQTSGWPFVCCRDSDLYAR